MELSEFKAVLQSLGAALRDDDAKLVNSLSAAIPSGDAKVATFLRNARGNDLGGSTKSPLIADALPVLRRATPLFQAIAKAGVISDYATFLSWLEKRSSLPIDALAHLTAPPPAPAAAIREDKVREYVDLLKAARPGVKAYGDALDKLAGDNRVRKQEMVAIAQSVADGNLAPSTTKADALKRIRLEHDAYQDSVARSNAISGTRPPLNT